MVGDVVRRLLAVASLLGCLTGAARAEESAGKHCMDQPDSRWVASHLVAGRINPLGAGSSIRIGLCLPLITHPGLLFEYTHLEFGAITYLTPAYTVMGGYFEISPLSFLRLRAELGGLLMWPFPFKRAAYHSVDGYDVSLDRDNYPADEGESATGWNANLVAIVQLRAPLGDLSLVLFNMLSIEYWDVGDQPFYVNLRRNLIAAQSDWLLSNEVFLLLDVPWSPTGGVRAGVYDSIDHCFASDHLSNHLGVVVILYFLRPGATAGKIEPFVRLGYFLDHPLRHGGITGFAGISMGYDFGRL